MAEMSGKLDEYTERANQAEQQIELLIKVYTYMCTVQCNGTMYLDNGQFYSNKIFFL